MLNNIISQLYETGAENPEGGVPQINMQEQATHILNSAEKIQDLVNLLRQTIIYTYFAINQNLPKLVKQQESVQLSNDDASSDNSFDHDTNQTEEEDNSDFTYECKRCGEPTYYSSGIMPHDIENDEHSKETLCLTDECLTRFAKAYLEKFNTPKEED